MSRIKSITEHCKKGSGLAVLVAGLLLLSMNTLYAATYVYEVTPGTAIPDNACNNYTQIPVTVNDTFTVAGVNVGLNLDHTFRGDLRVRLRAPDGTTVASLFTNVGGGNANFDIMLERDAGWKTNTVTDTRDIANITAAEGSITAAPFYEAVFIPEGNSTAMDVFNGLAANGTWNLEICDSAGADTGTVNRVLLSFTQGINPLPVGDTNNAPKVCSASGMDGSTPTSGVINTYYPGLNAPVSGDTNLTLGTSIGNATALAADDLVMIIQMQDAVFDTTNDTSYGDGSANNTTLTSDTSDASGSTDIQDTGLYEFATVSSFNGTALVLNAGLTHNYSSGTDVNGYKSSYQVIRVPRYGDLTLSGDITPQAWDGNAGGVVVMDVLGQLDFAGFNINAAGSDIAGDPVGPGFRPGVYVGGTSQNQSNVDPAYAASPGAIPPNDNDLWAEKGEGIAGTPHISYDPSGTYTGPGYPGGDLARGAPGNAGGGGNDHNGGGGGGSNIGWGGQGGDAWSAGVGAGGRGGGSFEGYVGRLWLGGGGGAANANNNVVAGAGGSGGGLVYINATTITGNGTIDASGGRAVDSNVGYPQGNDGAGGGGGGGTVVIRTATGNITGLNVDVSGGDGGDVITGSPHGPGGGGGGGALYADAILGTVTFDGGSAGRFCDTGIASTCTAASIQGNHGATDGGIGQYFQLDAPNMPIPIACEFPDEQAYNSTNTVHQVDGAGGGNTGLSIGSTVDFEPVGLASANADGDDNNDSSGTGAGNDENGVTFALVPGDDTSMTATVAYTNPTGGDATLCGWIDANANGTYAAAEGVCVTVPAGSSSIDLTWTGLLPTNSVYQLYARFRITTDALTTSDPSGTVTDGEAESYLIDIDSRPTAVTIGKVELSATRVIDFLAGLNVDQMDTAALSALLSAWDAGAAAAAGNDRTALLQALGKYLDPNADGQVAVIAWDTLEERGTIGFYVERKQGDGDWRAVNKEMLPGLITAPMGGEYQLTDPSAISGMLYQYRLIEQEAHGNRNTYGPYTLEIK